MKSTKATLLLSLTLLLLCSCKKDRYDPQLPPETATGANTFGCKVDGKVVVPRDGRGKPGLFTEYAYSQGGWYLNIPATDWVARPSIGVNIETDSLLLEEGKSYELKEGKGVATAHYHNGLDRYGMRPDDTGQLTITRHDRFNRIIAGRFWFKATTFDGSKVDVTDGRFDIHY